jgi:hypothetical protein
MTILATVPRAEAGDNRNARLLGRVLDPDGARHRRLSHGALAIAVEVRKMALERNSRQWGRCQLIGTQQTLT